MICTGQATALQSQYREVVRIEYALRCFTNTKPESKSPASTAGSEQLPSHPRQPSIPFCEITLVYLDSLWKLHLFPSTLDDRLL